MDLDPPHPSEMMGGVEATPISQLHPDISDPASRVVAGVITVTWPYSKVNRSIAFILADHDVRRRRDRGRLRVEFHGAAGKAVESFGIGAGDRLQISLEGAQWERNQVASKHPVPPLEWQLKFKDLLHMRIRRDESYATEAIDVDVAAAPGPPDSDPDYDLSVLFEPQPQPQAGDFAVPEIPRFASPTKQTVPAFDSGEYASPAYLKRARMSYGSLFEGGFDLFAEEERRRKKRRRRSRFSLNASWRYTSRSPSPQAEQLSDSDSEAQAVDEAVSKAVNEPEPMETEPPVVESTPRPPMVDSGCQTQELDYSPRMGVQVVGESRLTGDIIQSTPTPIGRYEHPAREGLAPPPLSYHRAASPIKDHHSMRDLHYPQSHDQDEHLLPIDANAQHGQFDWLAEQHRHHQQDDAAFHPESMMIDPNLQPHDARNHYQAQVNEAAGTREGETPMITPHPSMLAQAESAHIHHTPQSPCPPARAPFDQGLQTTAIHDFAQHTPRSPVMEAASPLRHHEREHEHEHEQGPVAMHENHELVHDFDGRNHHANQPRKLDQNAAVRADGSEHESPDAEGYHYAWGHQGQHGQGSDGGRRDDRVLDENDYNEDSEEDYDEELQEDDFEGRREPGPFTSNTYARAEYYEDDEDEDEDEDEEDEDEEDEDEEEDYNMDDYPVPNARPMPRAPQEPVVISLLSDSEDDQDDAVETPRPPIEAPRLSFQDRIRALQQKNNGPVAEEQRVEERVQEVKAQEEEVEEETEEDEEEDEEVSEEEERQVQEAEEFQEYSDAEGEDEEEDEEESKEEDESEAEEMKAEEVDVTEENAEVEGIQGAEGQVRDADESQDEEMEIQEVLEYEQVTIPSLGPEGDHGDEIDEDQPIEVEIRDTANEPQEVEAKHADTAEEEQQIEAESPDAASEAHEIELKTHVTIEEDVEMGDLPTTEAKEMTEEAVPLDVDAIDEAAESYTPKHSPPPVDQEDSQYRTMRQETAETEATEVNYERRRQDTEEAHVPYPTDVRQENEAQEPETMADAEAPAKLDHTISGIVHEGRDLQEPELLVAQEAVTTNAPPEQEIPVTKSSTIVEHLGSQTAAIEATTTAEDVRGSDEPDAEGLRPAVEVLTTAEELHEIEKPAPEDTHPTTIQESEVTLAQESSNASPENEFATQSDGPTHATISDAVQRESTAPEPAVELDNSSSGNVFHESADVVMISEAQAESGLENEAGLSISQTVETISSEDVKAMPHVEVTSKLEIHEISDGGIDHMEVEELVTERTENAVEPEDVEMDDGANELPTEAQHAIQEEENQAIGSLEEAARIEQPLPHDDQPQDAGAKEKGHGDTMVADEDNSTTQEQASVHAPAPEVMIQFTGEGFSNKQHLSSSGDAQGLDEVQNQQESEKDVPTSPKSKVAKRAKGLLPPPIILPGQPKRKDIAEEADLAGSDSDDDMSAEQQLMEEFRASQSEHLHPFDDSASRPSYFHSFDGAQDEVQESPTRARPASRPERTDLVITAQSLRSHCRRHRKSMSVESHETMETTYSRPRTPSMKHCLVDEAGTMPSPLWCVTHHGSDGHEDDPSVALARSNPVESEDAGGAAEEPASSGSGVPAARWSILRDRSHAMEDPTVMLARSNEQSPEAEPARRRGGSRYASSTGRRSVSPMKLRALRPRGKQADVSVQLAKSNPEEA